jgi:phosphate transport system protein
MEPSYIRELEAIRSKFVLMSEIVLENATSAMQALENLDREIAEQVIARDKEVDRLENEIDADSIRYMTLRQPVASDMRLLTVCIKGTHDLERVGDEAKAIAKRIKMIQRETLEAATLRCIPEMAANAIGMLRDAVDALEGQNTQKAMSVIRRDREVDAMNRSNFEEFGQLMTVRPGEAQGLLALILVSKSIERIADHATNIAEEAIFLVSGKEVRHSGIKSKIDSED